WFGRLAVMDAEKEIQTTLMLLVRHGQTPTTGKILPGRAAGLNLSEHGRDQAARVAQRLAALPVTAIYSSPLERTIQTAGPAAEYLGLPIYKEPGLLEGDFGDWTGAQLADLMKLPEWQTEQQRPDQFRFPNGESFAEMRDRMVTTLTMLRNRHPVGTVVCFSHAHAIRVAVSDALGLSLSNFQRVSIGPWSVSAIRYQAESVDNESMVLIVTSAFESLSKLAAS